MKTDTKVGLIVCLVVFAIALYILLPGLIENIRENKLLEDGKTVSAEEITEKVVENLKDKNFSEIEEYLSEDCKFFNEGEKYSIKSCLGELNEYNSHRIEERGNSIDDEKTYRIYWNGSNISNAEQNITLLMKRKVNKNEITYEIYEIIVENSNNETQV